jgi:hypothetical protein
MNTRNPYVEFFGDVCCIAAKKKVPKRNTNEMPSHFRYHFNIILVLSDSVFFGVYRSKKLLTFLLIEGKELIFSKVLRLKINKEHIKAKGELNLKIVHILISAETRQSEAVTKKNKILITTNCGINKYLRRCSNIFAK